MNACLHAMNFMTVVLMRLAVASLGLGL